MSKPDDIPQDVWDAAAEPADVVFDASVDLYETGVASADVRLVIARAILAERERCAKVADDFPTTTNHPAGPLYGAGFAAAVQMMRLAIRQGSI